MATYIDTIYLPAASHLNKEGSVSLTLHLHSGKTGIMKLLLLSDTKHRKKPGICSMLQPMGFNRC